MVHRTASTRHCDCYTAGEPSCTNTRRYAHTVAFDSRESDKPTVIDLRNEEPARERSTAPAVYADEDLSEMNVFFRAYAEGLSDGYG